MDPRNINRYLYIKKTPTWLIRFFYSLAIITWLLVIYGFSGSFKLDPFFRWFVEPIVIFFTIYNLCNYGLMLFYKQFDLKKHHVLVKNFWAKVTQPTIDIFLPICGEDLKILRNTWEHVSRLNYKNKKVYVLDDSKEEGDQHKKLAEQYGYTYLSRPNKGWMKKVSNLRYAYERTKGDFIVIFDADFAPHPEFLRELLPYMSDSKVGIVQSPQYFESTPQLYRRSPIAYGAGHVQESFYRFIQVVRDRFGATVCCGANAIYRRAALDKIGGFFLIDHSEDAYTGFELVNHGWTIRYVPILLAIGLCPDNANAYFHQQHRWCFGTLSLLLTKNFWYSRISWKTKFCYVTGLLYYIHHPLAILFSFQLFWTLFFYNPYISLAGGIWFYPYVIWGFIFMPVFSITRFRWGCLYVSFLQLYSYSHSVLTALLRRSVGWIPTNTKYIHVSSAFRQTVLAVAIYVFAYSALLVLAINKGLLHIFNYSYYSVEFWLFYNLILSTSLLWQMYQNLAVPQKKHIFKASQSRTYLVAWHLKTAGPYLLLLFITWCVILYV